MQNIVTHTTRVRHRPCNMKQQENTEPTEQNHVIPNKAMRTGSTQQIDQKRQQPKGEKGLPIDLGHTLESSSRRAGKIKTQNNREKPVPQTKPCGLLAFPKVTNHRPEDKKAQSDDIPSIIH